MAVNMQPGNMPHLAWIDLGGDGVYTECAVMKKDGLGNIYFFPLNALDKIDKGRLARILSNRNATAFELWDLMSQITLNNGVNALTYFHQLVEMITPNGKRMRPQEGVVGTEGVIDTRSVDQRKALEASAQIAASAAANAAANAAAAAIRGERAAPETAAAEALSEEAPAPAPATRRATKKSTTKK
jgi:hypothetical protein